MEKRAEDLRTKEPDLQVQEKMIYRRTSRKWSRAGARERNGKKESDLWVVQYNQKMLKMSLKLLTWKFVHWVLQPQCGPGWGERRNWIGMEKWVLCFGPAEFEVCNIQVELYSEPLNIWIHRGKESQPISEKYGKIFGWNLIITFFILSGVLQLSFNIS